MLRVEKRGDGEAALIGGKGEIADVLTGLRAYCHTQLEEITADDYPKGRFHAAVVRQFEKQALHFEELRHELYGDGEKGE